MGIDTKAGTKKNGYRIFYDFHIKQFEMVRKGLQIEVLQAGLRKRMIQAVKQSAMYQFDEAVELVKEYIQIAKQEIEHAKEAVCVCPKLLEQSKENECSYKRAEAAKELGLTIDTIRNWEMNGLITVKRKANGYRIYDEKDMNRLKVIRSLRCANYSLSAILRMLNNLESEREKKETDIYYILNTPEVEENIISVCDKLVVSLEKAIINANEVIGLIKEIKQMTKTNPPL